MLDPETARALRKAARRRQFRRREVVFRQGDIGDGVYFIERGHAIVSGEGALGEQFTLAVLGPRDYFGDIAVLSSDRRRSAGVETLDECLMFFVAQEHFLDLRDNYPELRQAMAESMARTCRRLVDRILDANHQDARGRLILQLGRLHDLFQGPIPFTQEDLAHYVGVSRVTINHVLGDLADDGLVELGRRSVTLVDPDSQVPR